MFKNQSIKIPKGNYEFLKDTELADSGNCDQIHILFHKIKLYKNNETEIFKKISN